MMVTGFHNEILSLLRTENAIYECMTKLEYGVISSNVIEMLVVFTHNHIFNIYTQYLKQCRPAFVSAAL